LRFYLNNKGLLRNEGLFKLKLPIQKRRTLLRVNGGFWELWFCIRLINLNNSIQSVPPKLEPILTSCKTSEGHEKQPPVTLVKMAGTLMGFPKNLGNAESHGELWRLWKPRKTSGTRIPGERLPETGFFPTITTPLKSERETFLTGAPGKNLAPTLCWGEFSPSTQRGTFFTKEGGL